MKKLGKDILLLGFISFFTDMSSEAIMPVLPFFILSLKGIESIGSGMALGIIMGIGTAAASILSFFSGRISDKIGKRKIFITSGYSLSAISKLFFPFSTSWWQLLILRAIERTGKGIRGAPRDAFIGERYKKNRGIAFGFHRAMDTSGAIAGSSLAFIFLWIFKLNLKTILLISALTAFFAIPPIYFLRERKIERKEEKIELSPSMKKFTIIATIFYLGNFTYGFFLWRAEEIFEVFKFNAIAMTFLLYLVFNVTYASFSTFFGGLSDKIGRRYIIVSGYSIFSFICFGFILVGYINKIMAGILSIILFILYGLMFSLIEGNQRAYAADLSKWKGISQGIFKAFTGIATLPAGIIAGVLWDIAHELTFLYGATLAILASSLLASIKMEKD